MRTERDYLLQMLFLAERKLKKLNEQADSQAGTDLFILGQMTAYQEIVQQLSEIRDWTDRELYVPARDSAGNRVWLDWEECWMEVDRVECSSYDRAILSGKLDDGSVWETDCPADTPLRVEN